MIGVYIFLRNGGRPMRVCVRGCVIQIVVVRINDRVCFMGRV